MSDLSGQTLEGTSLLQQTLSPYVTTASLIYALQDFEIEQTGIVTLPSADKYFTDNPPVASVNLNGKRIENLSTVDVTSIESILATPSSAVNVSTMSSYNTFNVPLQIASLTNTILPLSTTTSMKDRTIIKAGDPRPYTAATPNADIIERIQDVVTVAYLNEKTIHKDLDGKFSANNQKIEDLADATLYVRANIYDQVADAIEPGVFNSVLNAAKQLEYDQIAMNLKSVQDVAVTLNITDRAAFDSKAKQIKNGMQATLPKDYVTLDQAVHQEQNKLEYLVTDPVPQQKSSDYVDEKRIFFVKDPVAPVGGSFIVASNPVPGAVSENKQVVNVGYMNSKCHLKGGDIDLDGNRVVNMADPTAYHHGANKQYCDSNRDKSSKPDGTGSVIGPILGTLGGAAAGALTSLFTNGGSGLSALGSLSGALNAVGSVFQGGYQVGSSEAFNKPANIPPGEPERLIDNLQDDIANGGSIDGASAGSLVSGPLSVSGLISGARNAALGLFDFV